MTKDRRLAIAFLIAFAGALGAAIAADEPFLALASFGFLMAAVAVA